MGCQQLSLKWNHHSAHLLNVFDELLTDESLVDVTLVCEGKKIKAHKVLLSACSPYFRDIFQENPCRHPVVFFKEMKHQELKSIVQFMYKGEVNVFQDQLESLLKAAESLMVKGLDEVPASSSGTSSSGGGAAAHADVPVDHMERRLEESMVPEVSLIERNETYCLGVPPTREELDEKMAAVPLGPVEEESQFANNYQEETTVSIINWKNNLLSGNDNDEISEDKHNQMLISRNDLHPALLQFRQDGPSTSTPFAPAREKRRYKKSIKWKEKRERIHHLLSQGFSSREVAAIENIGRSTVIRSKRRLEQDSGIKIKTDRKMDRPRTMTEEDENKIISSILNGKAKSVTDIIRNLYLDDGIAVSRQTVCRMLERNKVNLLQIE